MQHPPLIEIVLATAALITAIGIIFTKVLLPTHRFFRRMNSALMSVDQIKAELTDATGYSIRESITRIDARLIFQDQRQKALIQDSPYGVLETNNQGEVVWCNRRHLKTMKVSAEELFGAGWLNFIHPEDLSRVHEKWTLSLTNKNDFHEFFRLISSDGITYNVEVRGYSMRNLSKDLIGYVFIYEYA